MIRGWLCLVVILVAALVISPAMPILSQSRPHGHGLNSIVVQDPLNFTGSATAFNYTLSSANLFTNATAKATPAVNSSIANPHFKWFSTFNDTKTNQPVSGTAFNYTASPTPAPGSQQVNWNLTIPKSNCATCTSYVSFTLFGNLTTGTSENFTLNTQTGTRVSAGIFLGNQTAGSQLCSLAKPSNASVCGPTVKVQVNAYVGLTLVLSFRFGWNATGKSLRASVGELIVESLDSTFKPSSPQIMTEGSSPAGQVNHSTTFTAVSYNTTNSVTPWSNEVLNVYYPSGYNLTQLRLNSTGGPPTSLFPGFYPFQKAACNDGAECSQSLLAINMSETHPTLIRASTIYINATSRDSIIHLNTAAAGVPAQVFAPGDTLSINITNGPSPRNMTNIEKSGTLTINVTDPTHLPLSGTPSTISTALGGLFNFTSLPATCGTNGLLCGLWTINATFHSPFDVGQIFGSFKMDQIQLTGFTSSGSNSGLAVQGNLAYSNSSAATSAAGVVFAVDSETQAAAPIMITNSSGTGLYVTNVTLVNGVFTQGQSLILLFTIVNSNSSSPAYNATVTIDHEWPGTPPQTHGLKGNFTLGVGSLGDLSFTRGPQTYQVAFTLTKNGFQATLTSLSTGNSEPVSFTLGTAPVSPTQQHTGLFKITVRTNSHGTILGTSSTVSPPYAYVFGLPLASSRYLAYSQPFLGSTLSLSMRSDSILGAKRLVVFALARDSSGIILSNNAASPGFSDSTTLQSTMDSIGEVSVNQHATATLHLTSNSTTLSQNITVNLNLQGSGLVASQTGIVIVHGTSQTVSLSFNAPSTVGQYTLSFSSPQYQGGVSLASQTLKVTVLQSNLQILIPAAIGIVAAIIVLGIYLVRGKPPVEAEETTKKSSANPKTKPTGAGSPPSKSLTRTDGPVG